MPPPRLPVRRLSRAALFAFGATLTTSIPVASCGGEGDGGNGGSANGGGGFGNAQPAYGVPAGGTSNDDAAASGANGGAAGLDAGNAALYGAAAD